MVPQQSLFGTRCAAVLAIAAVAAVVAITTLHYPGARSGGGFTLLQGLHSGMTADGGAGLAVDDDIVFGLFAHSARIRQVQAGRGWRKGHRTVVATDMQRLPDALAEDAARNRETLIYHPDFQASAHAGDKRGAMLPLLVYRELGDTFKWLFYGDDDTMWLRPNPDLLVADYDPEKPHILSDNWWPENDEYLQSRFYAPRCLPCHLKPAGSDGTTRVAAGFTAVFACNTPCTPQLLCDNILGYGDKWQHWLNAANPLNCSDPNASGAHWEVPHIYSFHGGAGAIFSVGALRFMNSSGQAYEACTGIEHVQNTGSDSILTRCLWSVGLGFTDPGFAMLPPDVDPATFPGSPLQHDDPYVKFNVNRRRLFGGYGYSNWKDIHALLAGLPPLVVADPNITACPLGASH